MGGLFGDNRSCVFRASATAGAFFILKEKNIMPDYKSMYTELFNSVTDAIVILQEAQKKAEEKYIETCGEEGATNIKIFCKEKPEKV